MAALHRARRDRPPSPVSFSLVPRPRTIGWSARGRDQDTLRTLAWTPRCCVGASSLTTWSARESRWCFGLDVEANDVCCPVGTGFRTASGNFQPLESVREDVIRTAERKSTPHTSLLCSSSSFAVASASCHIVMSRDQEHMAILTTAAFACFFCISLVRAFRASHCPLSETTFARFWDSLLFMVVVRIPSILALRP